jgi:uncharacterized membrane protein
MSDETTRKTKALGNQPAGYTDIDAPIGDGSGWNDTTTREAVERVGLQDWFDAYAKRVRDAATTAERERIRNAVAGLTKSGHAASCSSWLPGQNFGAYQLCDCWVGHVLAVLADVARIIDAEEV